MQADVTNPSHYHTLVSQTLAAINKMSLTVIAASIGLTTG